MKKIFFPMSSYTLSVAQSFSRPLSKMLCLIFFMGLSVLHLQAQCPSPTATTAPVTTSVIAASSTTTAAGSGSVTYVNGSVTFGSPSLAYTITISTGTTWVISSGSHLKVSNLNVGGTLIIQDGASVSVSLSTGGSLSISGSLVMCSSSAIENCGTTSISQTSSITYVGASTAKAVMKFSNAPGFGGSLSMPNTPSSLTNSSNIWLATYPSGSNGGLWNVTGVTGSASTCTIGSNCTGLPYTVSSSCAEFYGQTATGLCNAGTTAPTLSATTKSNVCPATTIDLSTITASNTPSGASLTWHTGTPATTANKITTGITALAAGTYYAAFYDATNNCYSGTSGSATTAVTATASNICLSTPSVQTAVTSQAKSGNAATELAPTGGTTMPYVYSNGSSDPACTAPSGATALPLSSNLTVTSGTGAYTYTAPSTAGTYYFCIKVCDSATPTANCKVATYTVTVTAACNAGSTAPILTKN